MTEFYQTQHTHSFPPKPKDWFWRKTDAIPPESQTTLKRWRSNPKLQHLFYNRGLHTKHDVLAYVEVLNKADALDYAEARHPSSIDPFKLPDMATAVERIKSALDQNESIAVYGDYDVDGVTATVLLVQLLQQYGATVRPYIPHRIDEGYGLNIHALDQLAADGVKLIITVDCGIRDLDACAHARQIGLSLIVTDHHKVGDTLPEADAVINPQRNDSDYPETLLSGVGVAFKLAQALIKHHGTSSRDNAPPREEAFLDLVALGTVADLVPLQGENRELVRIGLDRLKRSMRPGITALIKQARLYGDISARNISFQIGPRINAAGRLDTAMKAYDLLVSKDPNHAQLLARELETYNKRRRKLTSAMTAQALEMSSVSKEPPFLLYAADEQFSSGLAGLVASRVVETVYRPTLIAEHRGNQTTGSARSIAGFNLVEALDQCASMLTRYGGHARAAGFTLDRDNWKPFVTKMRSLAETVLREQTLNPHLLIDTEVTLRDLVQAYTIGSNKFTMAEQVPYFEPTGYGNPAPIFLARGVTILRAETFGDSKQHLRLSVSHQDDKVFEAIAFGFGEWASRNLDRLDLVFELETNVWRGHKRLQLTVKDLNHHSKTQQVRHL